MNRPTPDPSEEGSKHSSASRAKRLFSTTAKRHRDAGVDALFRELMS